MKHMRARPGIRRKSSVKRERIRTGKAEPIERVGKLPSNAVGIYSSTCFGSQRIIRRTIREGGNVKVVRVQRKNYSKVFSYVARKVGGIEEAKKVFTKKWGFPPRFGEKLAEEARARERKKRKKTSRKRISGIRGK